MRLSDAIATGRVLMTKINGMEFCGCAIGMATASVSGQQLDDSDQSLLLARKTWPWLTTGIIDRISERFFDVEDGQNTLEELIDWVRSVEPAEVEPAVAEDCSSTEVVYEKP